MSKRIVIIQGHPDGRGNRFCHALADAYLKGAREKGHQVRVLDVARMEFPLLRSQEDWTSGEVTSRIQESQQSISWAEHLVIIYPLWLGTMPALLNAFFEQVLRPGFALGGLSDGKESKKLLTGRSARVIVTMGMPAFIYRWYFGAHSLKSLKRNILGFCGISPIRQSLIGLIEARDTGKREKWLQKMRTLGNAGG